MKIKFLCPVIKLRKMVMANAPTLTAMYKRNEAIRKQMQIKESQRFIPLYKKFHGTITQSNDKEPA